MSAPESEISNLQSQISQREARYRAALEEIAALAEVKVVLLAVHDTGPPMDMFTNAVPSWTEVDPRTKNGLDYAARIAKKALES